MNKTLKGFGFVVLGLAVVTVGLPALVLVLSFFGMLIGAYVFPALIILALLRMLFWDFPRALKHKTMTGEWPEIQTQRREGTARVRAFKQYAQDSTPWN